MTEAGALARDGAIERSILASLAGAESHETPFPNWRLSQVLLGRSMILNYVTAEWRAREQLAFPNAPAV